MVDLDRIKFNKVIIYSFFIFVVQMCTRVTKTKGLKQLDEHGL